MTLIEIMDYQRVGGGHTQAEQALLIGPKHPIPRVVEDRAEWQASPPTLLARMLRVGAAGINSSDLGAQDKGATRLCPKDGSESEFALSVTVPRGGIKVVDSR